jgi:hypothetical protein
MKKKATGIQHVYAVTYQYWFEGQEHPWATATRHVLANGDARSAGEHLERQVVGGIVVFRTANEKAIEKYRINKIAIEKIERVAIDVLV